MTASLRVTSYNVLADAYASARLYPRVGPDVLAWPGRSGRLVERVAALSPDVVCLQEVEARAWPKLRHAFEQAGYLGVFEKNGQQRPDGCALLHRATGPRLVHCEPLHFDDAAAGGVPSGHLALAGLFETAFGLLRLVSTHLRWQAPTAAADDHIGYRQARQLLARCADGSEPVSGSVVCGDFNAPAESPVAQLFRAAGYVDAYASSPQPTCNPNGRPARIDFILASPGFGLEPEPLEAIDTGTVLPSTSEPSDHLPITARLSRIGALRSP